MLPELAALLLVAGGVACGAAALRGRTGRVAGLLLAIALLAAASSYEDGAPLWLAAALAGGGLVACVLHRHPALPRMAGLDALMGGSAAAALVVGAGAGVDAGVAAGMVVGGLALSRWQASPAILLAAAGVAALGLGEEAAPAAAPLFAAAVWRDEPTVGPGPEFRWTVLAAIITAAVAALTVLAIGQFATFSEIGRASCRERV